MSFFKEYLPAPLLDFITATIEFLPTPSPALNTHLVSTVLAAAAQIGAKKPKASLAFVTVFTFCDFLIANLEEEPSSKTMMIYTTVKLYISASLYQINSLTQSTNALDKDKVRSRYTQHDIMIYDLWAEKIELRIEKDFTSPLRQQLKYLPTLSPEEKEVLEKIGHYGISLLKISELEQWNEKNPKDRIVFFLMLNTIIRFTQNDEAKKRWLIAHLPILNNPIFTEEILALPPTYFDQTALKAPLLFLAKTAHKKHEASTIETASTSSETASIESDSDPESALPTAPSTATPAATHTDTEAETRAKARVEAIKLANARAATAYAEQQRQKKHAELTAECERSIRRSKLLHPMIQKHYSETKDAMIAIKEHLSSIQHTGLENHIKAIETAEITATQLLQIAREQTEIAKISCQHLTHDPEKIAAIRTTEEELNELETIANTNKQRAIETLGAVAAIPRKANEEAATLLPIIASASDFYKTIQDIDTNRATLRSQADRLRSKAQKKDLPIIEIKHIIAKIHSAKILQDATKKMDEMKGKSTYIQAQLAREVEALAADAERSQEHLRSLGQQLNIEAEKIARSETPPPQHYTAGKKEIFFQNTCDIPPSLKDFFERGAKADPTTRRLLIVGSTAPAIINPRAHEAPSPPTPDELKRDLDITILYIAPPGIEPTVYLDKICSELKEELSRAGCPMIKEIAERTDKSHTSGELNFHWHQLKTRTQNLCFFTWKDVDITVQCAAAGTDMEAFIDKSLRSRVLPEKAMAVDLTKGGL